VGSLTLVGIVALTSLGAFLVATWRLGLRRDGLPKAIGQTLECLGLAVIFLAANLAAGMVLVLGLRAVTGQFISIYGLSDITVAALSLLQALLLQHWRRSR
jgi:hypothetical protein